MVGSLIRTKRRTMRSLYVTRLKYDIPHPPFLSRSCQLEIQPCRIAPPVAHERTGNSRRNTDTRGRRDDCVLAPGQKSIRHRIHFVGRWSFASDAALRSSRRSAVALRTAIRAFIWVRDALHDCFHVLGDIWFAPHLLCRICFLCFPVSVPCGDDKDSKCD